MCRRIHFLKLIRRSAERICNPNRLDYFTLYLKEICQVVTNKFIIKDGKETCYGNSLNNNQVKMFVFVVYNKGFLTLELSGFRKLWLFM